MRFRIHYGFTLAETLLTIMIVGILAAVTMPTLQKAVGNKFDTMRSKCVYQIEQTVAQMLDDDTLYPQSNSEPSKGFANVDAAKINGVTYKGNTKFCEFFASRFTKAPHTNVNCTKNKKTFTSADGVDWYLPVSSFTGAREIIKIDVNGSDEEPNCQTFNEETCPKPDIFEFYITPFGKLYPKT